MRPDLFEIKSFGNIEQIKFVLKLLNESNSPMNLSDLRKYCVDSSIQYASSFEGIVQLLEIIECVSRKDNSIQLVIAEDELGQLVESLAVVAPKKLISKLIENRQTDHFIDLDSFDYDIASSRLLIRNSAIPLSGSALKQLFIDFDVFRISIDNQFVYELNPVFTKLFETELIPHIQKEMKFNIEGGLTFQEFKRIQEIKHEHGEQAEIFVETYEKKRLQDHPQQEKIKKISHLKVDAGYDVISYNSLESSELDRYIEVKSFARKPEFYFSKNELRVAEARGSKYYLYLVDRIRFERSGYEPLVIQDPYRTIFQSDGWKKDPQSWLINPSK